jgi:hypothetical protein
MMPSPTKPTFMTPLRCGSIVAAQCYSSAGDLKPINPLSPN